MALIVKKFGGSSVATPDKMQAIVQRVLKGMKEDDQVVLVVSAMGDTTDELVSLARQVTSKPYGREMDMLLSTGELCRSGAQGCIFYGGSGRYCNEQGI